MVKALSGVKTGLGEIASSSLQAKAAVLAVLYGLDRLTGAASQAGMDLAKFQMFTGIGTDIAQEWQHAFMLFDVSGAETLQTFTSLQAAMSRMQLTGEAPEGLAQMAASLQKVGSSLDTNRMVKDIPYLLSKLQEFIKIPGTNMGIVNELAKTFQLSPGVILALRNIQFERDKGKGFQILNPNEISQLTEVNRGWKEIWFTLKLIGEHAVAKNGLFPVEELFHAVLGIQDLLKGIDKVESKFKGFKVLLSVIGLGLVALFAPLGPIIAAVTALLVMLAEYNKHKNDKGGVLSGIGESIDKSLSGNAAYEFLKGLAPSKQQFSGQIGPRLPSGDFMSSVVPPQKLAQDLGSGGGQDITINQTNTVHGPIEPEKIGETHAQAIVKAFRQRTAQAGGF